ncbi:MAG TPA: hypothetical protein VGF07_13245 [Stellaceae bacterium]|jgi:hypothetical protein
MISAGNNADEFDCADCGRHIIAFPAGVFTGGRCNSCAFIPGWFLVPELKAALEPDPEWRPPERAANAPADPASWVCEVPGCGAHKLLLRISDDGAPLRHRCPDHLHSSVWAVLHQRRSG